MLEEQEKITSVEQLDQLIWAELPDQQENPRLFEIVTKAMIHGPCGTETDFLKSKSCMRSGRDAQGQISLVCSKRFPKPFVEDTILCHPVTKMPQYRRRDDGKFIYRHNIRIGNNWVVPYSPYLTLRFNSHINVELCSSYQSVKYLFKYVYKGQDCAEVVIATGQVANNVAALDDDSADQRRLDYDEIKTYLSN
jgi:hypothetical protein